MRLVMNKHKRFDEDRVVTVANMVDNTVYIYDYIETYQPWSSEDEPDSDTVSSEEFLKTIRNVTGDLTVRINSKGGEVGYALSIYQTLIEHNGKVTTIVDGYAYSCASWILLAGEDRHIMPGGVVMTHNPWIYCALNSEADFESTLQQWKANRDSVAIITSNRTGLKIEDVYEMMDKQTFMNANDAVAKNFCTSIREGKASLPSGVSNYLPPEIRNAIPESNDFDYSNLMTQSAFFRSKKLINTLLTK